MKATLLVYSICTVCKCKLTPGGYRVGESGCMWWIESYHCITDWNKSPSWSADKQSQQKISCCMCETFTEFTGSFFLTDVGTSTRNRMNTFKCYSNLGLQHHNDEKKDKKHETAIWAVRTDYFLIHFRRSEPQRCSTTSSLVLRFKLFSVFWPHISVYWVLTSASKMTSCCLILKTMSSSFPMFLRFYCPVKNLITYFIHYSVYFSFAGLRSKKKKTPSGGFIVQ